MFDDKSNNYDNSYIRNWLNNEFFDNAFNSYEKNKIIRETNKDDYVSLLTLDEAYKYYKDDQMRICKGTKYAISQGLWVPDSGMYYENGFWWLKTESKNNTTTQVYGINIAGMVDSYNVDTKTYGIRPVIKIEL